MLQYLQTFAPPLATDSIFFFFPNKELSLTPLNVFDMFWHRFYFCLHACLQHCGTRKPCQRCKMMRPVKIHATDALTKCSINAATVAVPLALFTLFRVLSSHVSTSMPQGREERTYLSCFPKAFLLFRFPPLTFVLSHLCFLSFLSFFFFCRLFVSLLLRLVLHKCYLISRLFSVCASCT